MPNSYIPKYFVTDEDMQRYCEYPNDTQVLVIGDSYVIGIDFSAKLLDKVD
jgi:hypothetical protein